MALIALAIYDTPDNRRSEMVRRTLESLAQTVNTDRHRFFLVVNEATEKSIQHIYDFEKATGATIIYPGKNLGTARAVNLALKERKAGEHCVKMDDDVVIHNAGWADLMELAIWNDPQIGIIGLKRKDCCQHPGHPDPFYRSELRFVPENPEPGQKGVVIEKTADVMGTCTMFNSELLDKIGYLYQPGLYGFDDVLMCVRSEVAGFYNCFLPCIEIDHIDPGGTVYNAWKQTEARTASPEYHRLKAGYHDGSISTYYNADCSQ